MNDPINLNRLAYFAAVVEAGSFTAAAGRLSVTKAVVSQQVARLEREVGASLLVRTTRQVRPTEIGKAFYQRCHAILHEADEAFGELAQSSASPSGTLRITAPTDYGALVVAKVVAEFRARHPDCRVELTLGDQKVDLIASDLDMAIRVGWLADSSQRARRIGDFQQYLVCAPQIAKRLPKRIRPDDLSKLEFVANMALGDPLGWTFARGSREKRKARMTAHITIDTTLGVLAAVKAGAGLSILPDYLVAADIAAGHLARLLPDWRLPSGGIHVLYSAARFRPAKVSVFTQMLAEAEKHRR